MSARHGIRANLPAKIEIIYVQASDVARPSVCWKQLWRVVVWFAKCHYFISEVYKHADEALELLTWRNTEGLVEKDIQNIGGEYYS